MILFNEYKNEYEFCKYLVNYTHNNKTVEKYVGAEGIDWWKDFEKEWEDMKINSIKEVVPNDTQKQRLKEIKDFGVAGHFANEVNQYVEAGFIDINDSIALKEFAIANQTKLLGEELAESKFESFKKDMIIQTLGQELSKVKIQMLMKGGEK